ncbi:MAG: hypothetical protein HYV28_02590 [Ignavibacteriales bacterium]|nr:hypothetical protein [Ignavibacteriales bacterium]
MEKTITYFIARGISNIFLPPVYLIVVGFSILFSPALRNGNAIIAALIVFLFGFILPIAFFVYLMKQNTVADQDALIKEQRKLPYLFGIGITVLGLFLLLYVQAGMAIIYLWSSYLLTLIFITVVNKWWKISAHLMSVGVGSIVLFKLGFLNPIALVVILTMVSWSRLQLKCHTAAQVVAGAFAGCLIGLLNFYILFVTAV